MKAIKLTPKQRELFDELKRFPGGCLRQHIKGTNTVCYRLLDAARNPISNWRYGIVHDLADKDIIEINKTTGDYTLKADADNSWKA